MKATDLMIGDWVKMPSGLPEIRQIKYPSEIDDADFYEPIPLTEEILEQNGFVRHDKHEYSVTGSNYNYLKVRCYADTYFEIGNAFDEEGELQAFADIQYVHELQHALKLCGIDKNIEL